MRKLLISGGLEQFNQLKFATRQLFMLAIDLALCGPAENYLNWWAIHLHSCSYKNQNTKKLQIHGELHVSSSMPSQDLTASDNYTDN